MSEIIRTRRSVRKYDLTKKISYDTLVTLCQNGEAAPSARRQNSREYIIIDDEAIIEQLSHVSQGSMILTDCNTVIAVIGKDPKELVTPHMQLEDLSAATENILLAARELELGSCWIGITPIEDRVSKANAILEIKDARFVFSLIALGFPMDRKCFYETEKAKNAIIHHNRG